MLCMLHRHVGLSRPFYVNKIYSFIHTDITLLFQSLNNGLNKIWEWCMLNRLSINTVKTKYIAVDSYMRIDKTCEIKWGGTILERVNSYNYLGVILDGTLIF